MDRRNLVAEREVGADGFEPPKLKSSRFTVCPIWPLWNTPVVNDHALFFFLGSPMQTSAAFAVGRAEAQVVPVDLAKRYQHHNLVAERESL